MFSAGLAVISGTFLKYDFIPEQTNLSSINVKYRFSARELCVT